MGRVISGRLDGTGMKIAIAASRFNELVVDRLVAGATDGLRRHGVADDDVTLAWVPGAYELPLLAAKLATSGIYDAVITLGAVIRGATSHYDLVAGQCAAGISRVALDTGIPVVFGVLTTENLEQALERAGSKAGNKGFESATAAIEMVDVLRQVAR
ncbi:MAG: 6,7-dimethyl-8-ribityllumazine synthase [Acidimicrobiaceae bacterium]|nr:6,7-dimethyl-8-ribityllumazine synthase [Acidimicrobiaceae bacterium]